MNEAKETKEFHSTLHPEPHPTMNTTMHSEHGFLTVPRDVLGSGPLVLRDEGRRQLVEYASSAQDTDLESWQLQTSRVH